MNNKLVYWLFVFTFAVAFVPAAAADKGDETAEIERRLAENPDDISLLVAAGRAWLQDAVQQDEEALKKAEGYLDRALSLAPDDPHILVLHGSMLALKGRGARLPVMKMRHVQKGLEEMDRAVELAPADFGVRYQRGAFCLNLPDIFERAGTAVEDFECLLSMAKQNPGSVSNEDAMNIRLSLAQAKLKAGDAEGARALLEAVRTEAPDTAFAEKAGAMLRKING